jgi:hypothetical protein
MDQEPLVREQIDAARKFIDELDKHIPVRAAFWLKTDEDSGWYLYVASDEVGDRSIRPAYAKVGKVSEMIDDPNFDPFRVKLIGMDDPLARAAQEIYQRYPARIPIHRLGERFGGTYVEGLYLYPPPVATLSK